MSLAQKISRIMGAFVGGSMPLANRNYIVDGAFEQWSNTNQTSATGGTIQPAVMFYNVAGTGGVCNVARANMELNLLALGMTTPAQFCMIHNQNTAASASPNIVQHIESALTLHGRSATFSCWLWTNTPGGVTIPSVQVSQSLGTGGSPSTAPATSPVTVNWQLTATPKRFSVRLDIPSITGLTLGTNGNDYLQVILQMPTGSTYQVVTTQWQLEACDPNAPSTGLPTPFEYRGQQAELARVQRYYETGNIITAGYYGGGAGTVYWPVFYRTSKRGTPAISFNRTSQSGAVTSAATSIAFASAPADTFTAGYTTSASGGYNSTETYVADARL